MDEHPVLDREALSRIREWGGEDLPARMMEIFLSSTPERMERLREGVAGMDAKAVEGAAHSLKSSAGNLGLRRLQALLEEMETLALEGNQAVLVRRLPSVEEAYEMASRTLQSLMEGEAE